MRTIEQAEDGSYYALDAVTIEYVSSNHNQYFHIDPNVLYSEIHDKITELSQTKIVLTDDKETNALKKRMTSLIRACIKGGLIMWGNDLLTLLYGTKEHDKPAKNDDIVDWYMDQFTKIAIATMMKSDIILSGETIESNENTSTIQVNRVFTRPVTKEDTNKECAECQK